MKKRLFIESDILRDHDLESVKLQSSRILGDNKEEYSKEIFDEVLDYAWHDLEKTWEAVKRCDEIWADSSLMPLVGNSYMGAPVIFNGMMERSIKENITGKSVFILRELSSIDWYMINVKLMKKAFAKNKLFVYREKHFDYKTNRMIEVNMKDINKIIKENKK